MGIPKILHQTVRDKNDVHPTFRRNIESLKHLNPGWDHRLYDHADMAEFLEHCGDKNALSDWERINPTYGPARSDYFRYFLMRQLGGVYLDIKSTCRQPLDAVLREDDAYLLSHWDDQHKGWGRWPLLGPQGEFQQWHIVCAPGHPFLDTVIARVRANIANYRPDREGRGKMGVLRVTGPIAYTLAITGVRQQYAHRLVDIAGLGFVFSVVATPERPLAHESLFRQHYKSSTEPVILPWEPSAVGRNVPCPCGSGQKHKRCHGRL